MSDPTRWFELDAKSYFPLPYFPWLERPHSSPLDVEEAATALFLEKGAVATAAERLRVTPARLKRTIHKSVRLTQLASRLLAAKDAHEPDNSAP